MGKNFNPVRFAGDVEQVETVMAESAVLLAAYYCALKEKGLPEELASEIVLQWHDIFWQNAMPSPKKKGQQTSDEKTGQPTKPAPSQHIVWAWYPGGWQLYRIETDWDKALTAYWEAKADTTGPVYLTEIKRVGLDAA